MHPSDTSETAPEPERHGDGPPPRLHPRKGRPAALRSTRGRSASQRAGVANEVVPKRITVDPAISAERTNPPDPSKNGQVDAAERPDGVSAPSTGGQMQPAIFGPVDGGIIVPSSEQFALMRAEAKAAGKLNDLRSLAAAWQAVAEKCDLAFEELFRLAVFRLEVERDLGAQLAQTVRKGRRRQMSPGSTFEGLDLPYGVTRNQSTAYQRLAAIPEAVFRAYVEKSRADRKPPSSAGARRFASPKKSRATRRGKAVESMKLSPAVLDAISRVMTPDIVVGEARIDAKRFMHTDAKDLFDQLAGDVLIAACPDPAVWLPKLAGLRGKAKIRRFIAVVPADVSAEWFGILQEGLSCCFLRDTKDSSRTAQAVLHHGAADAAFRVAMASVGVVVRS